MYGGIPWSIWTLPDGTQVSPSGGPVNSSKTVYASGVTYSVTNNPNNSHDSWDLV